MKRFVGCIAGIALLIGAAFSPAEAASPWVLYDNFNSGKIDPNLWTVGGASATVTVQNGQVKFVHKAGSSGSTNLRFKNPELIKGVKVTMKVMAHTGDFRARIGADLGKPNATTFVFSQAGIFPSSERLYSWLDVEDVNYKTVSVILNSYFKWPIPILSKAYTVSMDFTKLPVVVSSVSGQGTLSFKLPMKLTPMDGIPEGPYVTIGTKSSSGQGTGVVLFDNVYVKH